METSDGAPRDRLPEIRKSQGTITPNQISWLIEEIDRLREEGPKDGST